MKCRDLYLNIALMHIKSSTRNVISIEQLVTKETNVLQTTEKYGQTLCKYLETPTRLPILQYQTLIQAPIQQLMTI